MGKRLQTVAAVTFMKTLLMVFNFAFWILYEMSIIIGSKGLLEAAGNMKTFVAILEEMNAEATRETMDCDKLQYSAWETFEKKPAIYQTRKKKSALIIKSVELTGIAILAVGIWMEVELYKYMELTTNYYSAAPYILIGTGAVIMIIGSLACCCTVKGQPVLLYLYSAFLMIIFVVELSAGISGYAYRSKLKNGFNKGLNETLAVYGRDKAKTDAMDVLQASLKCCGITQYGDWRYSPWSQHNMSVPPSCCIHPKCQNTQPIRTEDIYVTGCYDKVVKFVDDNMGKIGGAALGIAFFQVVGVVLSCCLAKHINKAKYEQVP